MKIKFKKMMITSALALMVSNFMTYSLMAASTDNEPASTSASAVSDKSAPVEVFRLLFGKNLEMENVFAAINREIEAETAASLIARIETFLPKWQAKIQSMMDTAPKSGHFTTKVANDFVSGAYANLTEEFQLYKKTIEGQGATLKGLSDAQRKNKERFETEQLAYDVFLSALFYTSCAKHDIMDNGADNKHLASMVEATLAGNKGYSRRYDMLVRYYHIVQMSDEQIMAENKKLQPQFLQLEKQFRSAMASSWGYSNSDLGEKKILDDLHQIAALNGEITDEREIHNRKNLEMKVVIDEHSKWLENQ